jgi:hypothetical protein
MMMILFWAVAIYFLIGFLCAVRLWKLIRATDDCTEEETRYAGSAFSDLLSIVDQFGELWVYLAVMAMWPVLAWKQLLFARWISDVK